MTQLHDFLKHYANDFPQDEQNLSETSTGLPHFGQKPADLPLCSFRRAAIIDSISSSASAEPFADESARPAATAFSTRASAFVPLLWDLSNFGVRGVNSSSLRRIAAPFCNNMARCAG